MENFNLNFKDSISLLTDKIENWYEIIIKSIPNILAATVVFFLFIIIAYIVRNFAKKLLPRMTDNISVINLLVKITHFFVLAIGIFVSLEILNLDKAVTSILAGAGVLGLALGFAFQEIASNFVSGIFIAFRKPYKLGDIVEVDDYLGEITDINLRTTSIMTFNGLEVLIPNKYMFTKPIINFTTTPYRRIDLDIGVSYSDDLKKVVHVTKEALRDIENKVNSRPIEVYFKEFGASSINLSTRIWIHYPKNQAYLKTMHNAIIRIKEAYDANDISIPFPIRTLELGKYEKSLMKSSMEDM